jgi:hypothetical protein
VQLQDGTCHPRNWKMQMRLAKDFFCFAKWNKIFCVDYVFCQLHRLPEQHECIYDHKEHGRKEARDKMVSPKKHVGTSLRRLDSEPN